ncbi:MAG TPA: N-acetylmuramoyl-L-alanine amidase [Microvirga sp.]|jgi:N-acetylmuramoyl-L-alanine amidase|nr:N-acetylmuramoyl-L-alanine amidase [Microvirga sp.]
MPFASLRRLAALAGLLAALAAAPAVAIGPPRKAEKADALRPEAAPAIAAAVDLAVEAGRTRFTVTLSKPVTARAFPMERPDRIVLDLPEVTFHLPAEAGRAREGLVASFRYGLFAPGRSRVVIDLTQPAQVARLEVVPNPRDGSAQLVVEIARTDRETFRKAAAEAAAQAREASAAAIPGPASDPRPVIVLDPGHGGIDPGAAAAGMFEKDIVFSFAEILKRRLEAGGRYRVVLTRDHDVFVPLGDRVRIARAARADLFISIHADSISGGQDVRGLTVYTGSERASDADSARLADRENRADAAAGADAAEGPDEVLDILQDLTLRETRAFSHGFATRLVGELDAVARLNKNPYRQAGFRVLRAHDVPSVLVELGYLTSRKDFDLIMSDEWRERAAAAMTTAVDRFFATRFANQGPARIP